MFCIRSPLRVIKLLLCVAVICWIAINFSSLITKDNSQYAKHPKRFHQTTPSSQSTSTKVSPVPKTSCHCGPDDDSANFCYALPQNQSNVGRPFDCAHYEIVKELGLLDESAYIDMTTSDLPTPMFVTAFSQNHADEAKALLQSIRQNFREQPLIVYDLGLSNNTRAWFEAQCKVEVRAFNFSRYPKYVGDLYEFRWKPILIAEALKEFGAIWYMDTSVVFSKNSSIGHVHDLVKCRKNFADGRVKRIPLPSIAERDKREETANIDAKWDYKLWQANVTECRKSAYILHGYTGHGIYPATHPGIYEYLPTDTNELRKPKAKMFDAGFAFVVRTKDTVESILKWYVLCALERDCMGPPGAGLWCSFSADRFRDYAKCHRYDQSVINLLLANANWYDRKYYTSVVTGYFEIVRGGGFSQGSGDFNCTA